MPHEQIAKLAGDAHVLGMKGNMVDHCCGDAARMERGVERAEEKIAAVLLPKRMR